MKQFSVLEYENLSNGVKSDFKKLLAQELSTFVSEISNDDVLGTPSVVEFVNSDGECDNASLIVTDIYSRVSSGIQAGSGNQLLFQCVLNAFVETWKEIIK